VPALRRAGSAHLRDARDLDLKAWSELGAKSARGGMPLGR